MRIYDPLPVQLFRTSVFDYYQRISPRESQKLPVTIIDIDERSLKEIGQWPWPRSHIVQMIDNVSNALPLVIGFDIIFSEPDRLSISNLIKYYSNQVDERQLSALINVDNDQLFAQSMLTHPIVLGSMVDNNFTKETQLSKVKTPVIWNNNPTNFAPHVGARIKNLDQFELAAKGNGVLSLLPEPDGVIRRIATLFRIGDEIWPAFGVELLRIALQADSVTVDVDQAGINYIDVNGINLPTNEKGLTWLHFNQHEPARYISAVDVFNNDINWESYFGHIFIVGTSASGLLDIKATPMGQQMPGVEVWAQWIESSLFGRLLERPNYTFVAEIIYLTLFSLLLIILTTKASARISLLVFIVITGASLFFSWWMFNKHGQLFDISFPVLSAGVLFSILMFMKFWQEEKDRKLIKNAFNHYLSPDVVEELSSSPDKLKLGGESRIITSLFTDLQGFTGLSERFEPEQLVDLINQYLDGICQVAIQNGGTIDKIIGDAVHVIYGAPKYTDDHAQSAVKTALEIDKFCRVFQKSQLSKGFEIGITRVGINTGLAIVGNFGGEDRFDYTAYGDTINTASRLESVSQYLGTNMCVSQSTVLLCSKILFRPLAHLIVKGKTESILVYEPLAATSSITEYLDRYKAIFNDLQNQDDGAINQLKSLKQEFPDDGVISSILDHIDEIGSVSVERKFLKK